MNAKTAKNIRRNVNKQVQDESQNMFDTIRRQLDSYPLKLRIRFAWRILRGKF